MTKIKHKDLLIEFILKMNLTTVSLNVLGTKAQTKVEMYKLLTVVANLFLPPQRETSIYFIREIIEGNKKEIMSPS